MNHDTTISGTNQPTEDQIIMALCKGLNAPEAVVISWLTTFVRHFDSARAYERLAAAKGILEPQDFDWRSQIVASFVAEHLGKPINYEREIQVNGVHILWPVKSDQTFSLERPAHRGYPGDFEVKDFGAL